MNFARRRAVPLLALVGLPACGSGGGGNPVKLAFAQRPASRLPAPVVFRLPTLPGAPVRIYRLPRLDELSFRFSAPGLAAARVLGFAEEDDQIYLLSPRATLIALDLGTGRSRTVDSSVTAARAGPTGTPYLVHTDGSVAAVEHRAPTAWTARMPQTRFDLVGAGRGTLLVDLRGGTTRELLALNPNRPAITQRIPDGPTAASRWGEVVVIGTDSGVVTVDPAKAGPAGFLATDQRPAAVALSPSGHRVYAAVGGELVVADGFGGGVLAKRDLPGSAVEIRPDPLGRVLLLKPATGDSIWIVDVTTHRYVATVPGAWSADLPSVAPDGTILARQGNDLVSIAGDSLTTVGRVRGGGTDRWLPLAWDPRRLIPKPADEAAPTPQQPNQELFVQVSVSQNQAWAEDNAQNLRRAGLNAGVLQPSSPDEGFRVVLGPYPTREAAEDAGRKLGRPYWIFARQQSQPTQ